MLNVKKLHIGQGLADQLPEIFSTEKGIEISASQTLGQGYVFKTVSKKKIAVAYASVSDLMMAIGDIVAGDIPSGKNMNIVSPIEFRGLMLDCSRNAVPKIEFLKKAILRLALMGMNYLCLYTEDTYEVEGEVLFGYARGKYTKKEIGELANFAESVGVTMFPCIQTLGHLEQILKYSHFSYLQDTERVLNALDDKTYAFLDKIIDNAIEPYNTKLIHLGMDETWGIGRGKSFKENTPIRPLEIYARHVAKVTQICERKSLEPMMWGDFVIGMSGEKEMDETELGFLPKNMTMNYWNYGITDMEMHRKTILKYRECGYEPVISPGLHNWGRFWPEFKGVISTAGAFIETAYETGVKKILMTMWGDDGHENLFGTNYHSLSYYFSLCRHRKPDESFWKKRAEKICGIPYCLFVKTNDFDICPMPGLKEAAFKPVSKMLFYDDPLLGVASSLFSNDGVAGVFAEFADSFKKSGRKCRNQEYSDYIKLASLYSSIISLKMSIRINLRQAYLSKNHPAMERHLKMIPSLTKKISKFHSLYKKLWMRERKPFGFEVMDMRLGGMKARVQTLKETVKRYLACKQNSIPELELEFPSDLKLVDIQTSRKLSTRSCSIW